MTIEFVETLPPRAAGGEQYIPDPVLADFAQALRDNPGRWAKYPAADLNATQASSMGTRISMQRRPGTPRVFMPDRAGTFEGTVRSGQLYVRYVKRAGGQRKSR